MQDSDLISAIGSGDALVLLFVTMPLAFATVVGAGLTTPFGEMERTDGFPMERLRATHLVGLLAFSALALGVLGATWTVGNVAGHVLRNFTGYAGLSFMAVRLVDGRLSWSLPFAYAVLAFWLGTTPSGQSAWWAWPRLMPGQEGLVLLPLGLFALELAIVVALGPKDGAGSEE